MARIITFDEGWGSVEVGITKLINNLEGKSQTPISSEDYMMLYTTIFEMCTEKPPHDYSQQVYNKYEQTFEDYIISTVLPSLREKHDESMLRELVKRWSNHKIMVRRMSIFFDYVDRYFATRRSLPPLNEVGLTCFRDLVYQEFRDIVRNAVLSLIDQEREGEQIDRALLKNVVDIFIKIGMGQMDYYENDFEVAMLNNTVAYYSGKAADWILQESCQDYMLKAEECLKLEKDRVSNYLHSSSQSKLIEKVQGEFLTVYATHLPDKDHSGCHALPIHDDNAEDMSRMYMLFSNIPKDLQVGANIFMQLWLTNLRILLRNLFPNKNCIWVTTKCNLNGFRISKWSQKMQAS